MTITYGGKWNTGGDDIDLNFNLNINAIYGK